MDLDAHMYLLIESFISEFILTFLSRSSQGWIN